MLNSKKSFNSLPNANQSLEFALFTANIQHLLGCDVMEDASSIYENSKSYQLLQGDKRLYDLDKGLPEAICAKLESTTFIATFHFGIYRTLPLQIVLAGHKICIPISKHVLESQRKFYEYVVGKDRAKNIVLLEAEDPFLFYKIRKCVASNYHTLCYIDGGSEVDFHPQIEKSSVQINLCKGLIFSKIAFVKFAAICKRPLMLVFDSGDKTGYGEVKYVSESYVFDSNKIAKDYAKCVIENMYARLVPCLIKRPYMWECWFYLHRFMSPKSSIKPWNHKNRFSVFVLDNKRYLFDKYTYVSYPFSH